MPTDPSLILNAAQNFPQVIPDPTTLGNSQLTAARLAQFNQQQQGINALRDLYSNPDNLENGKPKPEALQRLTAQAPQQGLDLRRQLMQDEQGQIQLSLARAKEGDAVLRQKMIVAQEAQADYQENLKTMTPEQALATTQKNVWTPGRQQLAESGLVSPDALATMPTNFDPNRVGRSLNAWNEAAITPQQRFEREEKQKADTRADIELGIKQSEATNKSFGKPESVTIQDANGQPQQTMATYDRVANNYREVGTGKILPNAKVIPKGGETGPVQILGDATQFGQEYLATLPTGERNAVQLMIDGKTPPVSSFAMKSPDMQRMLAEAKQSDPSFDQATWGKRNAVFRSYAAAKDHTDLVSFNTAINHAAALWSSAQKLGNFGGLLTPLNNVRELYKTHTGDPSYVVFNENANALTEELTRAFRGTGGSVHDIEEWRKTFNEAGSPEQIRASIQKAMELLSGRIEAKKEDYDRAMGPTANFSQFITPSARKSVAAIPGGDAIAQTWGTEQQPSTSPATPSPTQGNAAALPPPMPIVGETRGKFHFTGGDPADPKSWAPNQ